MSDSIFTKIINREIPATVHYEDENFIVFEDISHRAPIHLLIVPKIAYQSLEQVDFNDADFYKGLLQTARKMAKKMKIEDNYKLFMNVGKDVQAVQHLHLHLLGGWKQNEKKVADIGKL